MHPEPGNTLRKEQIKVSPDTVIDVYLLREGEVYVVLAMEWTHNPAGNTGVGAQKLQQQFGDRESADKYFNDVMEKWG
jgi:hypothetical protein